MAWAWPRHGAPYGVSGGPCGACAVFSQCLCSPWHHYKSHAGPVPALCKSQGPLMIFGWPLWGLCGFSICALYAPLGIITGPTYGLPVAPENLIGHCNFSDGSCCLSFAKLTCGFRCSLQYGSWWMVVPNCCCCCELCTSSFFLKRFEWTWLTTLVS